MGKKLHLIVGVEYTYLNVRIIQIHYSRNGIINIISFILLATVSWPN